MPAFASWLRENHPGFFNLNEGGVPLSLCRLVRWMGGKRKGPDPRRTLLVSDFEPSREYLKKHLSPYPACMALPTPPRQPLVGVRYFTLRTDANPMTWEGGAPGVAVDTVATFLSWDQIYGQTLRHWLRSGLRHVWFLNEPQPLEIPLPLACFAKLIQRLASGGSKPPVDRPPVATSPPGGIRPTLAIPHTDAFEGERRRVTSTLKQPETTSGLRLDARPESLNPDRVQYKSVTVPLRIVHHTGWLNSGGAERQLCNLARMQRQAGHHVRVLTRAPLVGQAGHYRHLLEGMKIEARHAGAHWPETLDQLPLFPVDALRILARLPRDLRTGVADLAGELLQDKPDVVHCWLDDPNIVGFLAACIAGVPALVLSTRNVSPVHMPHLAKPWMRSWYQQAAQASGVALVNNSRAGARDYEHWLGLAEGTIGQARNAFQPPPRPTPAQVAALKYELAIGDDQPILCGVFRLDPEKRPLLFLDILHRLRDRLPSLRVLWAGCGSLERTVRDEIHRRGLGQMVHLLGQRSDVPTILAASDVTLLVSEAEGTPNVLLEAQHLGCVPIATDVGGSGEAMVPGETGLLVPREDRDGLVEAALSLLEDRPWRQEMARKGKEWVRQQFDPQHGFEETMALYQRLLGVNQQVLSPSRRAS